jgi:choline dehydrogenase-like flavoprotein
VSATSPMPQARMDTLVALAEAALPPGGIFPGAGADVAAKATRFVRTLPDPVATGFSMLLATLDLWSLARTRSHFDALSPPRRLDVLSSWETTEAGRLGVRALMTPLKLAHFDDPGMYRAFGCRYALDPPKPERPRWRDRIVDAGTLPDGETLECDVVVVGTGAGGAPVAQALAERGHAVLLIEEGPYFTRADFTGKGPEMIAKLYRRGGTTAAIGNTVIPIPVGRGVGGTTLINAGTCFRVPDTTLAEWRDTLGLKEFTPDLLAPYYEAVETELGVAPSSPQAVGRPGEIIARGCDALGYTHHPLRRNAPDCDGQGLCCFGCPTDAKRSTNVSFVPRALARGAELLTGLRVDQVLLDRGGRGERAVGVVGRARSPSGEVRTIRVRSRIVVLSCGSLHTPALLLRQGIANTSDQLGRNLSIHPAMATVARFDEPVHAWNTVPQGYCIDHFAHDGLMFEGASAPLDITAASIDGYGPGFIDFMEHFDKLLGFGFMVKDTSRGRVHRTAAREPVISYWLNDRDLSQMRRGLGIMARVYFAAGAREVRVPVAGLAPLRDLGDVARLEEHPFAARHLDLTAYHPLGTARMGKDPLRSVVDLTHETHDVHNLFICDGSSVPGSLGVNPQMTIMAMALRAAGFIERRLQRLAASAA